MAERTRECVRACLDCHEACLRAVAHLRAGETAVATDHVRLLFNTAEIARATAALFRGDLDIAERAASVCEELCARAARYCDEFPDEPIMRECADACRGCQEACQVVAAAAV